MYDAGQIADDDHEVKDANLIVWVCFFTLCIIIRGFLSHKEFLKLTIDDEFTRDHRAIEWARIITEGLSLCVFLILIF